jgi:hypothetical protein
VRVGRLLTQVVVPSTEPMDFGEKTATLSQQVGCSHLAVAVGKIAKT